jgi:uncharacterized membrane protein YeaQ/YmgE (transglycosylase-associated protein family)
VIILAIILVGMVAGGLATLIVRGGRLRNVNWPEAFVAGIAGSFVGGMLLNLIQGEGLKLGLSGVLGSTVGAVVVLAVWGWIRGR